MTGPEYAAGLAMVACVLGAVRGGLVLAHALDPAPAPATGEDAASEPVDRTAVRAFAAALLVVHAATAAVLGYNASIGQGMGLALGLGWIAAAAARFLSARRAGRPSPDALVELMIGLALVLPAWAAMARLSAGAVI